MTDNKHKNPQYPFFFDKKTSKKGTKDIYKFAKKRYSDFNNIVKSLQLYSENFYGIENIRDVDGPGNYVVHYWTNLDNFIACLTRDFKVIWNKSTLECVEEQHKHPNVSKTEELLKLLSEATGSNDYKMTYLSSTTSTLYVMMNVRYNADFFTIKTVNKKAEIGIYDIDIGKGELMFETIAKFSTFLKKHINDQKYDDMLYKHPKSTQL